MIYIKNLDGIDSVISVTLLDQTQIPGKYKKCNSRCPISFKMLTDEIVKTVVEQLDKLIKTKKILYIHCYRCFYKCGMYNIIICVYLEC